jgi:putative ABC transport system permease protein
MIAIAALVGVALIALTVLASTNEQMADFGVLRAVGVGGGQLCRTVLGQAALIAALGYLVGAALAYAAQFLIRDRLGDVTIAVTPGMLAAMALTTAVMAALGSLLSLRRVTSIDPAMAFRR